jgi:methyl-accepting chemotaxis protein
MWRFLINMSIARRLMIAATITALIPGIVISILGSSYVSTLSTVNNTVQADDTAVKLVTDMQADLLRMNALLGTFSMAPSSAASNVQNSSEIIQLTNDFGSALATYQQDYQITTSEKMQSIHDALKNDSQGSQEPVSQQSMTYVVNLQWKSYKAAQSQALNDIQRGTGSYVLAGDVPQPNNDIQQETSSYILAADIDQANLEYLPLKGNLDNLVVQTESISQIVVQLNTFKVYPIFFWTIAAFLFSTLMVFAISYVINLTITRPLRQLVQLTKRIAQGETNARATVVGHDETYMVATSMNIMLDSIVNLMKNIQQQHNSLEAHVQKLISEVKGLGSGDLRSRAEVTSDTLGFLAHSFNYIIDELSTLVIPVKTATNEVETLVNATQARMLQLIQISAHQIEDTTEAVEAVEQMAKSAFAVSEQAHTLLDTTREMYQVEQNCRELMEHALHRAEPVNDKQWVMSINMMLASISDRTEIQMRSIESMHYSLKQQSELSRSVLRILYDAVEANRKSSDSTYQATYDIRKLTHSVEMLHTLVGTFKL